MITDYEAMKEKVLLCHDSLKSLADEVKCSDRFDIQKLQSYREKVEKDDFSIMVVGKAKSGKSTFINAFLGIDLLPMDVLQCTSSMIELRHGEEACLYVTYVEGNEKIVGEKAIAEFLSKNSAIEDKYRDIPVTQIQKKLLSAQGRIGDREIADFIAGVQKENIHNLPQTEYENKIRQYICEKMPKRNKIILKVEIEYPFKTESMKKIRIIDSPGLKAMGGVEDVTDEMATEKADALLFLKPITGEAVEDSDFKELLSKRSEGKAKNVLFLVLTKAGKEGKSNIEKACDEYKKIYTTVNGGGGIDENHIVYVDSKIELFANKFRSMPTEEIKAQIKEWKENREESEIRNAWLDAEGNKKEFLNELDSISNFYEIRRTLNSFGRKAHFIPMVSFLDEMKKAYMALAAVVKSDKEKYQLGAKNPEELAVELSKLNKELIDLQIKIHETVDGIDEKYASSGKDGIIGKKAEEIIDKYKDKVSELEKKYSDNNGGDTGNKKISELEKVSFDKQKEFIEFGNDLQKEVIAECDKELTALADKSIIDFVTLEPKFSEEDIKKIKENAHGSATEMKTEKGGTFQKAKTYPVFSQDRYYKIIKENIMSRLDLIRGEEVGELRVFVQNTTRKYKEVLAQNAKQLEKRAIDIGKEKLTAEETVAKVNSLDEIVKKCVQMQEEIEGLKGEIERWI